MSGMEGTRIHGAPRSSARSAASDERSSVCAPSTRRRMEEVESQMLSTANYGGRDRSGSISMASTANDGGWDKSGSISIVTKVPSVSLRARLNTEVDHSPNYS